LFWFSGVGFGWVVEKRVEVVWFWRGLGGGCMFNRTVCVECGLRDEIDGRRILLQIEFTGWRK
jgi:hypothetical protein